MGEEEEVWGRGTHPAHSHGTPRGLLGAGRGRVGTEGATEGQGRNETESARQRPGEEDKDRRASQAAGGVDVALATLGNCGWTSCTLLAGSFRPQVPGHPGALGRVSARKPHTRQCPRLPLCF